MSATPAATPEAVGRAQRHATVRWAGAPLLFTGAGLLVASVVALAGGGSGWNIALSLFGTGLGLASFGANHDAAIAYLVQAPRKALPAKLQAELDEELQRDRAGTLALKPVPGVALALPLVAILVQGFVAWRLFLA